MILVGIAFYSIYFVIITIARIIDMTWVTLSKGFFYKRSNYIKAIIPIFGILFLIYQLIKTAFEDNE